MDRAENEGMKTWIALAGIFLSLTCFADRLGTAGTSRTFDANFEKVWNAALVALDDKTIATANKDVGQIITQVEKGSNFLGEKETTISIKIGHAKPCKVMVHVNIARTVQGGGVGIGGTMSQTDTYSDDGKEKDILDAMDKALKSAK